MIRLFGGLRARLHQRYSIFCKSFAAALLLLALAAGFLYLCFMGEAKTGVSSLYAAAASSVERFYDGQALQVFQPARQTDTAEKFSLLQRILALYEQERER